ncbi:MAG: arginine repressor [Ruminococcaceae bacterium]|nr:arginine repressor [Oscillospiraceae bacterium]
MRLSKNDRQNRILELIRTHEIGTQEELAAMLNADGLGVTQATISRDIKELGIIKTASSNGQLKYMPLERQGEVASVRLLKVFTEAVVSIDHAMNLVVLKTLPGMAPASASALDSLNLADVVGTLAGDDTVFIATRTPTSAAILVDILHRVRGRDDYKADN